MHYFRQRGPHRLGEFPVTDSVAARALALPLHSAICREDVAIVAERLADALRTAA
jgi:dTDP-4-amino-4,6-dideoxygalactose transaminase